MACSDQPTGQLDLERFFNSPNLTKAFVEISSLFRGWGVYSNYHGFEHKLQPMGLPLAGVELSEYL